MSWGVPWCHYQISPGNLGKLRYEGDVSYLDAIGPSHWELVPSSGIKYFPHKPTCLFKSDKVEQVPSGIDPEAAYPLHQESILLVRECNNRLNGVTLFHLSKSMMLSPTTDFWRHTGHLAMNIFSLFLRNWTRENHVGHKILKFNLKLNCRILKNLKKTQKSVFTPNFAQKVKISSTWLNITPIFKYHLSLNIKTTFFDFTVKHGQMPT